MMASTLSDLIAEYLRGLLADEQDVVISRAALSERFRCVPSQVNYVLATRFTPGDGYVVESRRGGGGYIRIRRLPPCRPESRLREAAATVGESITQERAGEILSLLRERELISDREALLMLTTVDRNVLGVGLPLRDQIRARILRSQMELLAHLVGQGY